MDGKQQNQQHRQHFNLSDSVKQMLEELTAQRYPGKQRRQSQLVEDLITEAFTKERPMNTATTGMYDPDPDEQEAKQKLLQLVKVLKEPQKLEGLSTTVPKVLLVGSSRRERTAIVSVVTEEVGVLVFPISGFILRGMSDLKQFRDSDVSTSKEYKAFKRGGVQEYIRQVFKEAKQAAPSLLCMYDLDGLELIATKEQRELVLNQILVEMDGIDKRQPVAVIATASNPDVLDPAFFRPGRFAHIIEIGNSTIENASSITNSVQPDSWATAAQRYTEDQVVTATITRLTSFGAFARIEDGIEGLIHLSEMARGQDPRSILREGAQVKARILRLDVERRRLGLTLHNVDETIPSPAVLCPSCKREVQVNWKHCVYCGASLAKVCPECGTLQPGIEGAHFCFECGSELE